MTVDLNDIKLSPDLNSVYREKISDDVYFSPKYSDYISNSRLKLINPDQSGSPSLYKQGFLNTENTSLVLGSCVHIGVLQPEEINFKVCPVKPKGKLKEFVDKVFKYRKNKLPIYSCIVQASEEAHYYDDKLTPNRIKSIIANGFKYYNFLRNLDINNSTILLSDDEYNIVTNCIQKVSNNRYIQQLLYPTDLFGDPIISYNEDAFFINVNGSYNDKTCILKLKMKADNWTIDLDNKVITLNDLKTTSHGAFTFMEKSFKRYCYSRQFSFYLWILLQYCKKVYKYNSNDWTVKCNVIVVETNSTHSTAVYPINKDILDQGRKEFCRLLKMVAYCEMNGYSDDIIFI